AVNFFERQIVWIVLSLIIFFLCSFIDFRFLYRTEVILGVFLFSLALLALLFLVGNVVKGAQSWFSLGGFSFQPADLIKLVLVLILAKYFSRRHVEIKNVKHIFISALYALIPFVFVLLQPDFG